jgi:hypothetical protein
LTPVTRVGYVRTVNTSAYGVLYVSSSYTDAPLKPGSGNEPCSWRYDSLCSIAYTRSVLGSTTTAMLRAPDEASLQQVFLRVTTGAFNTQAQIDAGFCMTRRLP